MVPFYNLSDVGLDLNANIIPRSEILQLFDSRCVRYPSLDNIFQSLRKEIGTITTSEQIHKSLNDAERQVHESTRTINKEPQYNTWVFSDMKSILIKEGFAVQREIFNKEMNLQ